MEFNNVYFCEYGEQSQCLSDYISILSNDSHMEGFENICSSSLKYS